MLACCIVAASCIMRRREPRTANADQAENTQTKPTPRFELPIYSLLLPYDCVFYDCVSSAAIFPELFNLDVINLDVI